MIHADIKTERKKKELHTRLSVGLFINTLPFQWCKQTHKSSVLWDKVPLSIPGDKIRFECQSEQGSKTLAKPESQVLTGCNHYVASGNVI